MILDVDAVVLANTKLSEDYNILALSAPDIAQRTAPGQFVMVRPTRDLTPLLRRPFSIFEVLRDPSGAPVGISLLNKRIGAGTRLLSELERGARVACLGPLGRPFEPVDPPAAAFMVAGGVGLAPFATLGEALVARGTRTTLFYGARRDTELFHTEWFAARGVALALATEDGSRGDPGLVTGPLRHRLASVAASDRVAIYACGPTPMMRAVGKLAAEFSRDVQVSLEPIMGCGMGGCYSCVVPVRNEEGRSHLVRACLAGPVFEASRVVWEELAG
ncbi:MAG: dihydroorotate dehydrogenase electron transfer subunit [Vicinamibacteraceae bacterium]